MMKSSVNVEVLAATSKDKPVLANLLELYIHDFTEFFDVQLDASGRFGYPPLSLYWTDPNRQPFLIRVDDHWAGFVLVCKGSRITDDENVWDVAEFFILRGYRRLGIGKQVAHAIWKRFPGKWEVRVIDQNQQARNFWSRAISEFINKTIDPISVGKDGKSWYVFSFESKHSG
jgi:predicted acetyltransferase